MTSPAEELRNEVSLAALAGEGTFLERAFGEIFTEYLHDAEIVPAMNVEPLRCVGARGKRLELLGYGEDSVDGSLVLLAGRYFGRDASLTLTIAKDIVTRATGFIEASANGWLLENLEISSREWEYANYFSQILADGKVSKIRVILISDGLLSSRVKTLESGQVAGVRTSYEVWDQRRLLDSKVPARRSEDIEIDFTRWMPGGLPCLFAGEDESTRTFLAVIPGSILVDVFNDYGSLLLESNVRTFLSARGLVNRGIQSTLSYEPSRFLAYNNGLTTTAASVELGRSEAGTTIRRLGGWQIVNGGQTTASLAHFLRSDASRDLAGVFIQMKLVTVSEENSSEIVQSVAKFANSQNRISAADLFSTHAFHIRLEQLSRRIKAPALEGIQYQTGWYYERARGQWENDRMAMSSSAARERFELEYPKSQRITKTDWAKYSLCWDQHPDVVSRGAQFAFSEFARLVDTEWSKKDGTDTFGDAYFRAGVVKAMLYGKLRTHVLRSDWYQESPGYLANLVAYGLSRFSLELDRTFPGCTFDFESAWEEQGISDASLSGLLQSARSAQAYLTRSERPQGNVTQWAKQQACWEGFKSVPLRLPEGVGHDLLSPSDFADKVRVDRSERRMDSGFEAITQMMAVNPETWSEIRRSSARISPLESTLLDKFALVPGRVPSEKQAAVLLRLLQRMISEGVIPRYAGPPF